MTTIQRPAGGGGGGGSLLRGQFRHFNVYTRRVWGDIWTLNPYVQPLWSRKVAGPDVSQALLVHRFGKVTREDRPTYQISRPITGAVGQFVYIEGVDDLGNREPFWHGVISKDELAHQGSEASEQYASGDQFLHCLGLESFLDRQPINKTTFLQGESTLYDGDGLSVANRRRQRGLQVTGNRSTNKHAVPDPLEGGIEEAHVFASEGATWSARDFLEYVLAFNPPPAIVANYSGLFDDLDNFESEYEHGTRTIKQLLDLVVDRRKGYGWTMRCQPDDSVVSIHIFSVFGSDVNADGKVYRANPERHNVVTTNAKEVIRLHQRFDQDTRYDRLVVRGGYLLTCFTIAYADSTLQAAWSAADEAAYGAASDDARDEERFDRVFRAFRLPPNFDWRVKDGSGQGAFTPANLMVDAIDGHIVDPPDPNQRPPAIWNFDRTLERSVPIQETTSDSNAQPEYLPLMAFIPSKADPTKYDRIDKLPSLDASSCSIALLDAEPGIRVRATPGHLLGLNHFTAASSQPAVYDWQDLILTVSARTDERLQIDIPLTENADGGKTLILEVPDAESWVIINGTVIGVVNGVLQRRSAASQVVRDDKSKLRSVAAVGREWFGKVRTSIDAEFQDMYAFEPGMYLVDLSNSNQVRPIGTVVTNVHHDYVKRTTSIQTGYANLDAVGLVNAGRGTRRHGSDGASGAVKK